MHFLRFAIAPAQTRYTAVSRGESTTGLTWDPREGSHRASNGQARGCPMREPAYEPSPQVKPVVLSPFDIKEIKALGLIMQNGLPREFGDYGA